jgi:hypothetical protein
VQPRKIEQESALKGNLDPGKKRPRRQLKEKKPHVLTIVTQRKEKKLRAA